MKRKPRKLRTESLESRQLMAGDVSFSNGVLEIRMDDRGPDHVSVGGNAGHVQVSGNVNLNHWSSNRVPIHRVKSIKVIGTNGADHIDLRGVGHNNFPQRPSVTVVAKDGADVVHGSSFGDRIYAGGGNDRVFGWNGNDRIYGQGGNDKLYGLNGRDLVKGGSGHDKIMGGNGRDTLYGGSGNDALYGNAPNHSDGARDRIFGGSGFDFYQGFHSDPDSVRDVENVRLY